MYDEVSKCWEDLLSGKLSHEDKNYVEKIENLKNYIKEILQAQRNARNEGDYEKAPLLDSLIGKVL